MTPSSALWNTSTNPAVQCFWQEILTAFDVLPLLWAEGFQRGYDSPLPSHSIQGPIIGLAEGSSRHALAMAAPWVETLLHRPCWVWFPHHVTAQQWGLYPHACWLIASQSGETGSVLHALNQMALLSRSNKSQGPAPWVLALTNTPHSRIEAHAMVSHAWVLPMGTELSVPASKSVVGTVVACVAWAAGQAAHRYGASSVVHDAFWSQQGLDRSFARSLFDVVAQWAVSQSLFLISPRPCVLIGSPEWVPLLQEAALKWSETQCIPVVVYSFEDFHHGPRALMDSLVPLTLWVVGDLTDVATKTTMDWVSQQVDHRHRLQALHFGSTPVQLPAPWCCLSLHAFCSEASNPEDSFTTEWRRLLLGLWALQALTALACEYGSYPVNHPLLQKSLPQPVDPTL